MKTACQSCLYQDWYVLVDKQKAVFVDDCQFYPDMAGKVKEPQECPNYANRFKEDENGLEGTSE